MMRLALLVPVGVSLLVTIASAQTVDVVGGAGNVFVGNNLGRGNSYAVTASVTVQSIEVWLGFSGPRTLSFYVYQSPIEFGTYTQVHVSSVTVTGTGVAGWHSSGPISVPMSGGTHYLIAVSWTGQVSYAYDTGFSAPVSFGWQTHGYADGFHPLPVSLSSTLDDSAIYHQRITTAGPLPATPFATPFGTGCTGSSGLAAVLRTDEVPALGNSAFNLVIDQAPTFGQGVVFLADAPAFQPIPIPGGCLVYLDLASVNAFNATGVFPLGPFPTSSVNITTVPLAVPALPALAGLDFFWQAAVSDPGAPLGLVLTNAVHFVAF